MSEPRVLRRACRGWFDAREDGLGVVEALRSSVRIQTEIYPVSGVPYVRHFGMSVLWF